MLRILGGNFYFFKTFFLLFYFFCCEYQEETFSTAKQGWHGHFGLSSNMMGIYCNLKTVNKLSWGCVFCLNRFFWWSDIICWICWGFPLLASAWISDQVFPEWRHLLPTVSVTSILGTFLPALCSLLLRYWQTRLFQFFLLGNVFVTLSYGFVGQEDFKADRIGGYFFGD